MSEMTCAEVQAIAAEFAFGVGDGAERADVVAHLGTCAKCRHDVGGLTASADALLLAGPVVEASAGFEERVAHAIALQSIREGRHRAWRWVLGAAAVALVVFGTGVLLGRLSGGHGSRAVVRSAAMVTHDGRTIGRVAVGSDPDTVFVAVPGWRPPGDRARTEVYRLRLTMRGGRSELVGPVRLSSGDGSWGTVLAVDSGQVRGVALVDERGKEYCAAAFH